MALVFVGSSSAEPFCHTALGWIYKAISPRSAGYTKQSRRARLVTQSNLAALSWLQAISPRSAGYRAISPRSSLRMRMISSIFETQILPSPILPVRAAVRIA
jgi:hypothetical protein